MFPFFEVSDPLFHGPADSSKLVVEGLVVFVEFFCVGAFHVGDEFLTTHITPDIVGELLNILSGREHCGSSTARQSWA